MKNLYSNTIVFYPLEACEVVNKKNITAFSKTQLKERLNLAIYIAWVPEVLFFFRKERLNGEGRDENQSV